MHEHTSAADRIDPWDGRLERALRQAIPSFVHRLNNALGPVAGFASVAARTGQGLAPERTVLVEQQAERAAALARALSEVSKRTEGDLEPLDLVEWLNDGEDFLDGCVEGYSAGLRLVLGATAAPVRAAGRPLVQALFVGLVEAAAAGAREVELVLSASQGRTDEVALVLSAPGGGAPLPPAVTELTGARAYAREQDGERVAHRLVFHTLAPVVAPDPGLAAPLVVVVERDPFLREEVEQVLLEDGYRVSAHGRADEWEPSDGAVPAAVLVDGLAAVTAGLGALIERVGAPVPVCVMGRPSAPLTQDWPQLGKPFRPSELLECVARLVGAAR